MFMGLFLRRREKSSSREGRWASDEGGGTGCPGRGDMGRTGRPVPVFAWPRRKVAVVSVFPAAEGADMAEHFERLFQVGLRSGCSDVIHGRTWIPSE